MFTYRSYKYRNIITLLPIDITLIQLISIFNSECLTFIISITSLDNHLLKAQSDNSLMGENTFASNTSCLIKTMAGARNTLVTKMLL